MKRKTVAANLPRGGPPLDKLAAKVQKHSYNRLRKDKCHCFGTHAQE